ncbi:MAG TPA: HlyC/CorC family transporter [Bacteroidetes bacterium]|nr:HlyC/CorC family transporter [Bacteroidota bacterium]
MTLLIVYLILALGISFLCSILEAVLLSVPPSYLETLSQQGSRLAGQLRKIKKNISSPLAAILSLNTIAHTIGAAGVGAQATLVFGEAWFGVISAVLTLLILVLSEIIPKTIGASWNRQLSIPLVPVLRFIMFIMYPLVWLSNQLTRLITSGKHMVTLSRDEMAAMANIGKQEGVLAEDESKTIYNLLRLRNIPVSSIMTPRTVLISLPENMQLREFLQKMNEIPVSRILLWKNEPDNITGYFLKSEALENLARDRHRKKLGDLKRDLMIVYEGLPVMGLYQKMLAAREHIALVVDEYGEVAGVVTQEDIFETMTGMEILDETDVHTDLQQLARELWKKRNPAGRE